MNNSSARREAILHEGFFQSAGSTKAGRFLLITLLSILVTACGGSKTVATQDDSADYSNARQLPPLKKPSRPVTVAAPSTAPANVAVANQTIATDRNPPAINEQSGITTQAESPVAPQTSSAPSNAPIEYTANTSETAITAQVVEPSENIARLEVDADINAAWEFVSANLRGSDITVHNRNQVAGLIAVGCPQSDSGRPIISKRGGWSIFGRKPQQQEHCSLQLTKSRSKTAVSLFDRSGLEMDAEYAKEVFTRLLNN